MVVYPKLLKRAANYFSTSSRKRIVILGTGWCSYSLLKNIRKCNVDVIVISPRNHFLFTPLLASTTVGELTIMYYNYSNSTVYLWL